MPQQNHQSRSPTRRLTQTIPLSEYYRDYVLGGQGGPTNYRAIIFGYYIHSVEQNQAWKRLYRVFVIDGREIVKLRCLAEEKVTVVYRG